MLSFPVSRSTKPFHAPFQFPVRAFPSTRLFHLDLHDGIHPLPPQPRQSASNSFRMRTYKKHACNSFGICSSKTQDLKPFRICTYKKTGGWGVPPPRRESTHEATVLSLHRSPNLQHVDHLSELLVCQIASRKRSFFGACRRAAFFEMRFYGILELERTLGSFHATLPLATHARLPHAPRRGDACPTYARWRPCLCRTCSRQHGGRKNVRGVPLRFPRNARSLAQNRRDALRLDRPHRMGKPRRQTAHC